MKLILQKIECSFLKSTKYTILSFIKKPPIQNKIMSTPKLLLRLPPFMEGQVIHRPSKKIKTPYVADVLPLTQDHLFDPPQYNAHAIEEHCVLAHSASLGCCGLADKHARVYMGGLPLPKTSKKNADKLHCSYRIYLSILQEKNTEILVGIYPKIAEDLVESALKLNYLSALSHVKEYKREVVVESHSKAVDVEVEGGNATFSEPTETTTLKSRFDFTGTDATGRPFIMEVKNVPLADYEDIDSKCRKKKCYDDREINSKVAYFPDGYRKKKTDTVSPRALKHIQELTQLKMNYPVMRCIMCYVIQRNDVQVFQPSVLDTQYREAFKVAVKKGVEIITMGVEWTKEGEAYLWTDQLPLGNYTVEE